MSKTLKFNCSKSLDLCLPMPDCLLVSCVILSTKLSKTPVKEKINLKDYHFSKTRYITGMLNVFSKKNIKNLLIFENII